MNFPILFFGGVNWFLQEMGKKPIEDIENIHKLRTFISRDDNVVFVAVENSISVLYNYILFGGRGNNWGQGERRG